ncbi:hypothetical protein HPB48_004792 [Haemaphysalis longicornis]|uniref:Uncharacterized protein n=1 Tax=Haemaphysalis longicornis TaxID=44386 RepID=A0A9J6FEQ5_HAELO|nr:hypothetical protein HPB48_004792 [Haemaphysalis longicornis]
MCDVGVACLRDDRFTARVCTRTLRGLPPYLLRSCSHFGSRKACSHEASPPPMARGNTQDGISGKCTFGWWLCGPSYELYVTTANPSQLFQEPGDTPTHALVSRIVEAAKGATQTLQTELHTPPPDHHLINLWRIRDTLQERYCAGGRTYSDLVRIRQHNARIRRHMRQLAKNRWEEHCASFSRRTGARKLWGTFRAITGGTSAQATVPALLLRTGATHEAFEREPPRTFFPQPSFTLPQNMYFSEPAVAELPAHVTSTR